VVADSSYMGARVCVHGRGAVGAWPLGGYSARGLV